MAESYGAGSKPKRINTAPPYAQPDPAPPPEESLTEAFFLLMELDRTVKDARLGYIRHRTATNGATKLLPAILQRVQSALHEITGGER